jgi:hypothetical protein
MELTFEACVLVLLLKVMGLVFVLGQRIVSSTACVSTATDSTAAAAIVSQ